MGAALGTYGVWYTRTTEVGSPPAAWVIDLAHFNIGIIDDYDVEIVRGNAYVDVKGTTSVRIQPVSISGDAIIEARIIIRRSLNVLWDNI